MPDLVALEGALDALVRALRRKARPNARAAAWAAEHAAADVSGISARTRRRLRTLTATSLKEGWTTSDLAEEFADLGLDEDRAYLVADHERRTAVNEARQEAWQTQLADGTLTEAARKVWDAGDEFCIVCEHLDGQSQFVDEPFDSDLGPIMTSPAHPGCDCQVKLVKG